MPRAKSPTREALLDSALNVFWTIGYHVVSMSDLVRETGVSRAGIYGDFAGKQVLFHACLDRYQEVVVTPAFACVEADGAGLESIRTYLDNLLDLYAAKGGFGLGCLVGNTLTQVPVDEVETRNKLQAHCTRLIHGFRKALAYENGPTGPLSAKDIDDLAQFAMISVQGLWSYSRLTNDVTGLRSSSDTLVAALGARLRGVAP